MKKIIVIIGLLALFGCRKEGPNCHFGVTFHNRQPFTVYADWAEPSETIVNMERILYYKYAAGESRKDVHYSGGTIFCMEGRYQDADKISFFVFDGEVIENNDWNTIVENDMFLQRYDLSLADMRKLNWRLSFPPDERMKDVKMWPAYGTYPPPPIE